MEVQESNEDYDLPPSVSSPSHSNTTTNTKKRTRDMPNLTQCHSCGFRIDSCSGNEILEILYSEWRIVLLCQNCFVSVESSNLCSYCFKNGSSHDSFTCPQCKHIIHKTCFSSHANVAPWSFSCSTSTSTSTHFSICLDCWVPNKRAYCSSKRKNPLDFDLGNCQKRFLKNVVRDANFDARRKVEAATKAWQLAVEKALAARRMARLAGTAVSRVDDIQLAKRTMNCSLKVLKNNFSSNCLAVPNGSCRIVEVSPVMSVPVPETSALDRVSDYHSSMNLGSLESNGNRNVKVTLKEREGGCSNKFVKSVYQYCKRGDGSVVPAVESYDRRPTQNFIKYARRASANAFGDRKLNRYMIKYTRRASAHEIYNAKTKQYLIKYARRTSAYQQFRGKLDRFAIKYTRRKLYQSPILDIPTRQGATYDAAMRKNDI